jgi:alkylmercury lyase
MSDKVNSPATDLAAFDQGWFAAMEQTPFVRAIIALSGLTRLGEHPASLQRLAATIDRPVDETAALVRREFVARIEDGLIYWDDPYPGEHTRRLVHIGNRTIAMGSGCGPDVFTFAAVLDVPFRVEETCPATGTPIRVDFVPGGYERVDPPEAVTVLLHPEDFSGSIGGHFDEINASVCTYQPFFASAEAAEPALVARPGSRAFTVQEMFERPWFTHYRDRQLVILPGRFSPVS